MSTTEDMHVAWTNMLANKTRTIFSMLGIIIGTSSVILVIALVNGTRQVALEQRMAGRENLLTLMARYDSAARKMGQLDIADVDKIKQIPFVEEAFPRMNQENDARGSMGQTRVQLRSAIHSLADLYDLKIISGRFFTKDETTMRPRICVISDVIAERLFGLDYPIGQRVRLQSGTLEVVGVFKMTDQLKTMDQTGDAIVPYQTLAQLFNSPRVYAILIKAESNKVDQVQKALQLLQAQGRYPKERFEIVDPRDDQAQVEKWARIWLIQMTLVASISLFVGGIGLMNVMLTTVAERTHEIGLRKALGADSRAILNQFLIESVTLSSVGGIAGITLGILCSCALNVVSKGKVYTSVLPASLFLSMGFSVVTGVLFGLLPASKAAHLSPVEALRYE